MYPSKNVNEDAQAVLSILRVLFIFKAVTDVTNLVMNGLQVAGSTNRMGWQFFK